MKMKFKIYIPTESEAALRSVLPMSKDTPVFDDNDNVIGMITGGKRFGASNVFSLEAALKVPEKPNCTPNIRTNNILIINNVAHVITGTDHNGNVTSVVSLGSHIAKTRTIEHEDNFKTIGDLIDMYSQEYIRGLGEQNGYSYI